MSLQVSFATDNLKYRKVSFFEKYLYSVEALQFIAIILCMKTVTVESGELAMFLSSRIHFPPFTNGRALIWGDFDVYAVE